MERMEIDVSKIPAQERLELCAALVRNDYRVVFEVKTVGGKKRTFLIADRFSEA